MRCFMKLCVIFPGIGYRNDMPLLYYSKKIAKQYGYEIKEVNYNGFPKNLLGNKENMQKAFLIGYEQLENQLNDIQWNTYSSILFISKSIGTALSSYYAKEHQLDVSSILFTPVPQTFDFISSNSIVFHGTSDPWMKSEIVYDQCNKQNLIF